jgi:hypothetical protein
MVSCNSKRQLGLAYLLLLMMVAAVGAGLAATGIVWGHSVQREKEAELLRAGGEIRRAIATYYERSPGAIKQYPQSLEELLLDKRHLTVQRHLRRVPMEPMTRSTEWGLVRAPDGRVMGVFSLSQTRPIRTAGAGSKGWLEGFSGAKSYSDWRFVYIPEALAIKSKPTR